MRMTELGMGMLNIGHYFMAYGSDWDKLEVKRRSLHVMVCDLRVVVWSNNIRFTCISMGGIDVRFASPIDDNVVILLVQLLEVL